MAGWLWRRRTTPAAPARAIEPVAARVELADLTPPPAEYLGLAACLELTLFEDASRAIALAPTTAAKSALSAVAEPHLHAHQGMVAELRRLGIDPVGAMEPHRRGLDDYRRRIEGQDWYESVVTCYLTAGFLTDFFRGLAAGLPHELRGRVEALLDIRQSQRVLTEQLLAAIEGNPRLAARLAMWGRRLVGDTMLVARGALGVGIVAGQERIEPVFTALIAAHTRRMDTLGLTA